MTQFSLRFRECKLNSTSLYQKLHFFPIIWDSPKIRKACSALTDRGAASLKTDIISRKSSKVQSPSLLELNTLQIWSPNGLTLSSGYWSTFAIESLAFLLCPTFSGANALNFLWALKINKKLIFFMGIESKFRFRSINVQNANVLCQYIPMHMFKARKLTVKFLFS